MARSKNFHERFAEAPVALPSERSTGLVFAAVAAIIAALYRAEPPVLFVAVSIAALLAVVSCAVPQVLRPLNIAWFKFAMLLSKVMNPIVMFALFAIAIVPFGIAMQLRYDPLRRKRRREADSYWIPRNSSGPPANMENQF
jgi:hypothetical protein